MRTLAVILLLAVLLAHGVSAQSGTIKLLALSELPDGESRGTLASLSLDVRPGNERVFLETIPLTRVATQISMRFAQQVACKQLKYDCSRNDFIYTIVAQPGLVGGPSAGAAATVLTAALLDGDELRDDIAITGTINSGGLLGPVGGLKEKIEVAGEKGIRSVLVARGSRLIDKKNVTQDLQEIGRRNNVSVVEVATLEEALYYFTGKNISQELPAFSIDPAYQERMEAVAELICRRTQKLRSMTKDIIARDNQSIRYKDSAENLTKRAVELGDEEAFYSAASYCFRANIQLNNLYTAQDTTETGLAGRIRDVFRALGTIDAKTEARELRTMTDLQTYISVQERVLEAADTLVEANKALDEDDLDSARVLVVYAEERLASARSWSVFFGLPGQSLIIDNAALQRSCLTKLSEAEERFSYVGTFFPHALEDARRDLDRAHLNARNESYALCLGQASKAKADADSILSVTGFEDRQVDAVVDLKLQVAARELVKAQQQGSFPIIGYNYFQYANDLQDEDKYSALLFSEYAIELSNLDLYFEKEASVLQRLLQPREVPVLALFMVMLASVVAGAAIALGLQGRAWPGRQVKPSPTPREKRRRGKKR